MWAQQDVSYDTAVALLRIASWLDVTEAEGPGARFALWTQGCRLRCPGCCNPAMLDPSGGRVVEVSEILAEVERVRERIEGVTLAGGEPFDQATAVAEVAHGARSLGLSVMTYTGFTLEGLRARGETGVRELLAATDLLVDGPYDAGRPERERRWVGSANQRFHFLTERYTSGIEWVRAGEVDRTVEVRIGSDGLVVMNGWPELPDRRADAESSAPR